MELSPYVGRLADDLAKVTALADDTTRDVAARLVAALEPSLRMVLVEAISDTAALVTTDLDDVVALVRMDGRDPVVTVERTPTQPSAPPVDPVADDPQDDNARITLRLPQSLKSRAETRAAENDQSLNTWIVHAIRRATHDHPNPFDPTSRTDRRATSRRVTGWA